jgi:hypothetical protein
MMNLIHKMKTAKHDIRIDIEDIIKNGEKKTVFVIYLNDVPTMYTEEFKVLSDTKRRIKMKDKLFFIHDDLSEIFDKIIEKAKISQAKINKLFCQQSRKSK